jgi:hypothetical protein
MYLLCWIELKENHNGSRDSIAYFDNILIYLRIVSAVLFVRDWT